MAGADDVTMQVNRTDRPHVTYQYDYKLVLKVKKELKGISN